MARKPMDQWDDRWNHELAAERVTPQRKRIMLVFSLFCLVGLVVWFGWAIFPSGRKTHVVLLTTRSLSWPTRFQDGREPTDSKSLWEAGLQGIDVDSFQYEPGLPIQEFQDLYIRTEKNDTILVYLDWNPHESGDLSQFLKCLSPDFSRGQVLVCVNFVEPEFVISADKPTSLFSQQDLISSRPKEDRLAVVFACGENQISHFDFQKREPVFALACRHSLGNSTSPLTSKFFVDSVMEICAESAQDDFIGGQGQAVQVLSCGGYRPEHVIAKAPSQSRISPEDSAGAGEDDSTSIPGQQASRGPSVPRHNGGGTQTGESSDSPIPTGGPDGSSQPSPMVPDGSETRVPVQPLDPWIRTFEQFDRLAGRPKTGTDATPPILGLELGALEMRSLGRSLAADHQTFWLSGDDLGGKPESAPDRISGLLLAISESRKYEMGTAAEKNNELARLIDFYNTDLLAPGTHGLSRWRRSFQELPKDCQSKMVEATHDLHWAIFAIPELRRWMRLIGNTDLFLDEKIAIGERMERLVETGAIAARTCGDPDRVAFLDPQTLQFRLADELVSVQSAIRKIEQSLEETTQRLEAALRRNRWSSPARHATQRFLSTLLPTATQRRRLVQGLLYDIPHEDPTNPPNGTSPTHKKAQEACDARWNKCVTFLEGALSLGDAVRGSKSFDWQTLTAPKDPQSLDPRRKAWIRLLTDISSTTSQTTEQLNRNESWQRSSIPAIGIPRLERLDFLDVPQEITFLSASDAHRTVEIRWEANVPLTGLQFALDQGGAPLMEDREANSERGCVSFHVGPVAEGRPSQVRLEAVWGPDEKRLRRTLPISVTTLPPIDLVLSNPKPVTETGGAGNRPGAGNGIWIYPFGMTPVDLEVHNRHSQPVQLTVELHLDPQRVRMVASAIEELPPDGRKTLRFQAPASEAPADPDPPMTVGPSSMPGLSPIELRDGFLYSRILLKRVDGTPLGRPLERTISVAIMHPRQFVNLQPELKESESRPGRPVYAFQLRRRADSGSFPWPDREESPLMALLREIPGVPFTFKRDLQVGEKLSVPMAENTLEQYGLQFDVAEYPRAFQFQYPSATKKLSLDFPNRVILKNLRAKRFIEPKPAPANPPQDEQIEPRKETEADGVPVYLLPATRSLALDLEVDHPEEIQDNGKFSTQRRSECIVRLRSRDRVQETIDLIETSEIINYPRKETIRLNPFPNVKGQLVFDAKVSDWSLPDVAFERHTAEEELQYCLGPGAEEEWKTFARLRFDSIPPKLVQVADSTISSGGLVQLRVKVSDEEDSGRVRNRARAASGSGTAVVELELVDDAGNPGKRRPLKRSGLGKTGGSDFWEGSIPRKELGEGRSRGVVWMRDLVGNESKKEISVRIPELPRPAAGSVVVSLNLVGTNRQVQPGDWISPVDAQPKPLGKNSFQFDGLEPGSEMTFEVAFTTSTKSRYRGKSGPVRVESGTARRVEITVREETKSR